MSIYVFAVFTVVLCKVKTEFRDPLHETELLQESIKSSLSTGLDSIEKRIDELIKESSEIKDSGVNLVEEHVSNLVQNFHIFIEAFGNHEGNVTVCLEGLESTLAKIRNKGINKVKKSVDFNVSKLRLIVVKTAPVAAKMQNKTRELTKLAQDCARYDDEDCEQSIMERVEILKDVLPSVIETLMNRLEMQMNVLESEIVSDVQKIVNAVVEDYNAIFFNFIQCLI